MMSSKKVNILIVVLIVIAVILGLAIYKQGSLNNLLANNFFSKPSTATPTPPPTSKNSKPMRPLPTNLTPDEKILMNPPAPNDSQDKKSTHFAMVQKLAVVADVLDLNKCNKPSPLDLKLKAGQDFKVKNSDSVKHTIVIDTDHQFAVPPNSTATFKAEFGHGQGAYGYLCDDLGGVAGFFFVTP